MRAIARNKNTNDIIDIDIDVLIIHVNQDKTVELHYDEASLLITIIEKSPKYASYDDLLKEVLQRDYGDGMPYLRRKIHSARKKIDPIAPRLIETVRSQGFRLNSQWERVTIASDAACLDETPIEHVLKEIDDLMAEAHALMQRISIVTMQRDGDSNVLVLDRQTAESEISALQERFFFQATRVISMIGTKRLEVQRPIARILNNLSTYVAMRRSGSGISEETWREMFVLESLNEIGLIRKMLRE